MNGIDSIADVVAILARHASNLWILVKQIAIKWAFIILSLITIAGASILAQLRNKKKWTQVFTTLGAPFVAAWIWVADKYKNLNV